MVFLSHVHPPRGAELEISERDFKLDAFFATNPHVQPKFPTPPHPLIRAHALQPISHFTPKMEAPETTTLPSTNHDLTPLEQDVLDEYERLAENMKKVSSPLSLYLQD